MSEGIDSISSVSRHESKVPAVKKPHFEPGNHDSDMDAEDKIKLLGNLSAHHWNPEIGKRMADYQPKIIGIDSIFNFAFDRRQLSPEGSLYDKARTWALLPASPGKLNSQGEVLVVGGDIMYSNAYYPLSQNTPDVLHSYLSHDLDQLTKNQMSDSKIRFTADNLISYFMLLGVSEAVSRAMSHKISRRNFLKGALDVAAATFVFSKTASFYGMIYSPNGPLEDILTSFINLTTGRILPDNWVNGRTALVTAKTIDAAKSGLVAPGSESAVVMGSAHSLRAEKYIDSPKARAEAIVKLARPMVSVMKDINRKYRMGNEKGIVSGFLDLMEKADYITVRDPGTDRVPRDTVQSTLDSLVQLADSVQSPEVVNALRPLRAENI